MDFETELREEAAASEVAKVGSDCDRETDFEGGGGDRKTEPDSKPTMRGSGGKTAYAIRVNLAQLVEEDGIESVGFLTLTVGDDRAGRFEQVHDSEEASKRFNSLNTHLLKTLFKRAVVVTERHKSGAIHFHVVGSMAGGLEIRRGFDFERVKRRDYRSVCPDLRAIWAMLRERLPEFGFGRAELTPIRTSGPQIASYVSKYVSKNLDARRPEDKGKRLVRYIGWAKEQLKPQEFGWSSKPACQWRAKARQAAALIGCYSPEECADRFGPRWAWILTESWTRICGRAGGYQLEFSEGRREVLWEVLMKWADLKRVSLRGRLIDRDTIADCREVFSRREGGPVVGVGTGWVELFTANPTQIGVKCRGLSSYATRGCAGRVQKCELRV
jgi:hypothetical protein